MNLHKVAWRMPPTALWVQANGRNGRFLGTHLWFLEEGTPPPLETRQNWQSRDWWRPRRFQWEPFADSLRTMFADRWPVPLCGRPSTSRSPRVYFSGRGACPDCQRIAAQRGIIGLTYPEAQQLSSQYATLQEERLAWIAAGRPDQWPLPSTS